MTRGEIINVIEQYIDDKWDQRNWDLALTADKPVETYLKSVDARNLAKNSISIDDMSKEQQDWYRAT